MDGSPAALSRGAARRKRQALRDPRGRLSAKGCDRAAKKVLSDAPAEIMAPAPRESEGCSAADAQAVLDIYVARCSTSSHPYISGLHFDQDDLDVVW
jgi:hypothetical protein